MFTELFSALLFLLPHAISFLLTAMAIPFATASLFSLGATLGILYSPGQIARNVVTLGTIILAQMIMTSVEIHAYFLTKAAIYGYVIYGYFGMNRPMTIDELPVIFFGCISFFIIGIPCGNRIRTARAAGAERKRQETIKKHFR